MARAAAHLGAVALLAIMAASAADATGSPSTVAAAPDFSLHDQYGHPFRLSDRRGRVVVLSFGYTLCPEACPITLALWKRVEEKLGDRAKSVDFVYVTVDPSRDTEEQLRKRLREFSPRFIGLTGPPAELDRVYRSYQVYHEETRLSGDSADYLIGHSIDISVIDRAGRLRMVLPYSAMTASSDELLQEVRTLVSER